MPERAALIPQVFGQKPTFAVKAEQESGRRGAVSAQVSACVRKRRQICRGPCRWTRGRRFKSCQPDLVMSQDIGDTRTHGTWVRVFLHFGVCGW